MSVQFPLPSKEDKKALVKLALKLGNFDPIICIAKCDYKGKEGICLNPETYNRYGSLGSAVVHCPFYDKLTRIWVVDSVK